MLGRTVLPAILAIALGATAAQAQIGGGGGFPGGRGGYGGMRGGRGGMRPGRMASRIVIPDLRNPLRLIVDNKDDLKLSAAQLQQVDSLRRALDVRNDTLVAQVKRGLGEDSAMAAGGAAGGSRTGDGDNSDEAAARRAARAQALRDRLKVLQPTFDQIRKNDDEAWKAATAALAKDQRKKADQIRKDDKKAYDQSHSPFGEGWPGRRDDS